MPYIKEILDSYLFTSFYPIHFVTTTSPNVFEGNDTWSCMYIFKPNGNWFMDWIKLTGLFDVELNPSSYIDTIPDNIDLAEFNKSEIFEFGAPMEVDNSSSNIHSRNVYLYPFFLKEDYTPYDRFAVKNFGECANLNDNFKWLYSKAIGVILQRYSKPLSTWLSKQPYNPLVNCLPYIT